MKNITNNPNSFVPKRQGKDTKKEDAKKLFEVLYRHPMSRRMGATEIGYTDQTYMVTQFIYDWIRQGKAQVIGSIKCSRSQRIVECITTNPELFTAIISNQLDLF